MYPDTIAHLIENFKKLPGVGQKSAERMVFSILDNFDSSDYEDFSASISEVSKRIRTCSVCYSVTDKEICDICSDNTRDSGLLIVVENTKDVFLLEKIGKFNGYYHVLGGLISPFDEIGPDDINIKTLKDRISDMGVREIIFVTKSGIEADTTVLYIKKILESVDVVISRIANGVPIGADMEYIDGLTLESALKNRKEVVT